MKKNQSIYAGSAIYREIRVRPVEHINIYILYSILIIIM